MGRLVLLSASLGLAVAGALSGAAVGGRTAVVGFAVRGNPAASVSTTAGKKVDFVARAAMRRGDRLEILVNRAGESSRRRVSSCSLSPCSGRWGESAVIVDRFQAVLKRGGSVVARSRTVAVTWKAAPPAPAAAPGHYAGRSTLNEAFAFDVTADGRGLTNLVTGQINESCDPPAHLAAGNLSAPGPYPLALDGSFTIGATITTTVGGNPATRKIAIAGKVGSGTASGTFRTDTAFTAGGVPYACNSGDQTWTATRVG